MDNLKPFIIITSNNFSDKHIVAYGAEDYLLIPKADATSFDKMEAYLAKKKSWVFGYMSYDLKNSVENLESNNADDLNFPDLFFFRPKKIQEFDTHEELQKFVLKEFAPKPDLNHITLDCKTSKEEYLKNLDTILSHIQRGDVYELNYCIEFFNKECVLDPLTRFFKLNEANQAPFSTYLSFDQLHVMCGSPERYLKRQGDTLISQPIKGTIKRGIDEQEDLALKEELKNDPKERSENVMITDLVRNDLSRTAARGSVKTIELCEVYTFKTVHQLISTVESQLKKGFSSVDAIRNSYPMGSMTGAPKIRAMQIIEELENFKRSIYSGSIGYFEPSGNFDFNVVIRSLMYNEKTKYLSARVGGAITSLSDPNKEYDECLLKVKSLKNSLFNAKKL